MKHCPLSKGFHAPHAATTHLNSRLTQCRACRKLLTRAHARIVRLLELLLQLIQLIRTKGCAIATELRLITVLRVAVLALDVCKKCLQGVSLIAFLLWQLWNSPIIRLASTSGERLSRLPDSGDIAGSERRPLDKLPPLLLLLLFSTAWPSLPKPLPGKAPLPPGMGTALHSA